MRMMLMFSGMLSTVQASTGVYQSCTQPSLEWVGVDQGIGRSEGKGVTAMGGKFYVGGTAMRDVKYTGPDGTNIEWNIGGVAGRPGYYENTGGKASMFIYELLPDGSPTKIFKIAADSEDNVYVMRNYLQEVHAMPEGQNTLAVVGNFLGNVTFSNNVKLHGGKSGRNYDTFVAKINVDTGITIWAKHMVYGDDPSGKRQVYDVAGDSAGNIIEVGDDNAKGNIAKLHADTGAVIFDVSWPAANDFYSVAVDSADHIYVVGDFTGSDVMIGMLGPFTSAQEGTESSNLVMKINGATGKEEWATLIGEGAGDRIAISQDGYVYAIGELGATGNTTLALESGFATLTGEEGGYLAQLRASDGAIVWAVDLPEMHALAVNNDDSYVYVASYFRDTLTIGDHTIQSAGDSEATDHGNPESMAGQDAVVVKVSAADGSGRWAIRFGGTGNDRVQNMVVSSDGGLMMIGYTDSKTIQFGTTTIDLDNHASNGGDGDRSLLVAKLGAAEATPSCLTSCTPSADGRTATRVVETGHCFVANECFDHGISSPYQSCFKCDANADHTVFTGPDVSDHCYIGGVCFHDGEPAPQYQGYHGNSECEYCDVSVSSDTWQIKDRWAHDRVHAFLERDHGGRGSSSSLSQVSVYNMIFPVGAGGCQPVPEVPIPAEADRSDKLELAMAQVEAMPFHERIHKAWNALVEGTDIADAWRLAEVYFDAKSTNERSHKFGTNLFYGTAVATVEVKQSIFMGYEMAGGSVEKGANNTAILDEIYHAQDNMLVALYQYALDECYQVATAEIGSDLWAKALVNCESAYAVIMATHPVIMDNPMRAAIEQYFEINPALWFSIQRPSLYCKMRALLENNLPSHTSVLEHPSWQRGEGKVGEDHTNLHDLGHLIEAAEADCGVVQWQAEAWANRWEPDWKGKALSEGWIPCQGLKNQRRLAEKMSPSFRRRALADANDD